MKGHRLPWLVAVSLLLLASVTSCSDSSEAPRLELPVVVDASGVAVATTDLGYEVELTSVRIVMSDLVFTVRGEVHTASVWQSLSELMIPSAHAHPGHFQGGEVIGELPGTFVIEWPAEDDRELSVATLIAGEYNGANFTFARGSSELLAADDPLVGHTAVLSGTATRENEATAFTVIVDSDEGRELIGAPFESTIRSGTTGTLRLLFHTVDPLEGDALFDGIDFAALDADSDGVLAVAPELVEVEDAYNLFKRRFQTHDFYSIQFEE